MNHNYASDSGGALYISSSSDARFKTITFYKNTAFISGGGSYCSASKIQLDNCHFAENTVGKNLNNLQCSQIRTCHIIDTLDKCNCEKCND